jgi:hypothetical protein
MRLLPHRAFLLWMLLGFGSMQISLAGGPRYFAGSSYFNSNVQGRPVHWANGQLNYYLDKGPLNSYLSNAAIGAALQQAAAVWNSVPTAALKINAAGSLAEDVSGATISGLGATVVLPVDVQPSATSEPVAIVLDADGSVIDALYGTGASDPLSCNTNAVWIWFDNFNPDATFAHAVMLLNGLCFPNAAEMDRLQYQLVRGFGQLLGLGWSQTNDGQFYGTIPYNTLTLAGWPVLHPIEQLCSSTGLECMPNATALRPDDIAAISRLYPVTAQNIAGLPGHQLTSATTASITGVIQFTDGQGMQGVNVTAIPVDTAGNLRYDYAVSAVTGASYRGQRGSPVTGWTDAGGNLLTLFGSEDTSVEGYFDLSGIQLPPGMSSMNVQLSFQAINPLYFNQDAVGPYIAGSPSPSGTLPAKQLSGVMAGSSFVENLTVQNSATGQKIAYGSESAPVLMQGSGEWVGRLGEVGQTDWFQFEVGANLTFTVIAEALDEFDSLSAVKARPVLGLWNAVDAPGSAPEISTPHAENGMEPGETWMMVSTTSDGLVRLGISDERGDGRPDYVYRGRLYYAGTVIPAHLPKSGGPIVIHGCGFRNGAIVTVNGVAAQITSISINEITAIAPASGTSGTVDVVVEDSVTGALADVSGQLSYDAGATDSISLITAPSNTVPLGVPLPFTVRVLASEGTPVGGVYVNFFINEWTAKLGCGGYSCAVMTSGDGYATLSVAATITTNTAEVIAQLANGTYVEAWFLGGVAPQIAAVTQPLYLAAGSTVQWPLQFQVLSSGRPVANQSVQLKSAAGLKVPSQASVTDANGLAAMQVTVGPLLANAWVTVTACVNGTQQCANVMAVAEDPKLAYIEALSGVSQSAAISSAPASPGFRVLDPIGNPMAGVTVASYQALYAWSAPCPIEGLCPQTQLLATQVTTSISAIDGSLSVAPLTLAGVPANLAGIAVAGAESSVSFNIEMHP